MVTVGVEQGILLAIVLSILDHLRRSYHPRDTVLVRTATGTLHGVPVSEDPSGSMPPDVEPGLVVYRFGADIYYANANRLTLELRAILGRSGGPPSWVCLEAAGIGDVDYSGGATLIDLVKEFGDHGTRLVIADMHEDVRAELDRYGVTEALGGSDAYFETVQDVVDAFGRRPAPDASGAPDD